MEEMLSMALGYSGFTPYFMIFGVLLACGLGLPIPEDITLFVAGMLAYYGIINVWGAIVVCLAGVLIGDATIFLLGAKYGKEVTKHAFFNKFLTPEHLEAVKEKLHQYGDKLIFIARFMPVLRAPTYFTAGTLHLPFRVFFCYDGLAALISVPTIVWLVYHYGALADKVFLMIKDVEHSIIFFVLMVIAFFVGRWYLNRNKQQQ
jgi:membrane protein DedA with SNARE-associated domain